MSIQDESFPYDDLEISRNSAQHMVFPHHKPPARLSKLASIERENIETVEDNDKEQPYDDVSAASSPKNGNDSTQSSNEDPPESETSRKTSASEPQETEIKKSEYIRNPQSKSVSYQDIHSEYTKRRYKHVESKVGQYIANIKAQDEKRRSTSNKFQRHRSMPETLSGPRSGESVPELRKTPQKRGLLMRHSTNDLDHMHEQEESVNSDHDTENFDNITATTSSSSRELGQDAGIYLDKQTYEQLLSDKERCEYLQTKMEAKNAENWRLKQNLDTMRIEYTLCKDKLKQLNQQQRISGSFGLSGGVGTVGRTSLQCLLSHQEKGTQTESILTPSPVPPLVNRTEMFATPLTPDSNNNSFDHAAVGVMAPAHLKIPKTIATIQPLSLNFSNLMEQDNSRDCSINNTMGFLRQRSNSMANRQKSTPLHVPVNNISKTGSAPNHSMIANPDSAIDIEVIESPRKQRQSRREEFIYFEKRSQRYAFLETRNGQTGRGGLNEAETTYSPGGLTTVLPSSSDESGVLGGSRKSRHHRQSIGSRVMRLFGACTKCDDPNMSMDTLGNSQQQSFSQIPLLEKSRMNHRQNLR